MLEPIIIEQGERFKSMCTELLPLIVKVEDVLKKHNVEKMASLTLDVKDGYMSFGTHESKWDMSRSDSEHPVKIRYEFMEELDLKSVESDSSLN